MTRRKRNDHWLNTQLWKLPIGEWIGLILSLGAIVSLLCILLIRRHTLEYHLEHTFAISDPEFFGSALALSDPVPIESNAIEVLQNGDEYFPATLEAIRAAKKTVNFEAYIVYSDEVGRAFCEALSERARGGVEVRVLLDGIGSGWSLNNSDVRLMQRAGCKFTYYHPTHSYATKSRPPLASGPDQSAQSPAHPRGGWTNRIHWRSWFCQTLERPCSGHAALARSPVARQRAVGGKIAISFPGTLGENQRRGIERCRPIPRAHGDRKYQSADRELALIFHRADPAGASGRFCRRQQTDLDHQRLLYPNGRSSGTVDQGGQARRRCPDSRPGAK